MNPMTNVKNVKKLSELELKRSLKTSWHDQYKDSAWIFVGGLPYDLTEGDIICVFSQYGEIVNLNLVRDKATGKSKGFCFLCFEDQRSTILAVDNLNGIKILGRTIRVDHVSDYKPPKISDKMDEETKKLNAEGCASVAAAPCHDLKEIKIIKKEKEDIEKPKKKKSKRKSKKKESSSSEDSNNSSDSESDDSKAGSAYHHTKKNKNSRKKEKKKSKKKKSRIAEVTSDSSTDNETIRDSREKRRKLVEKIKFLEAALSNSRKAAKRTDFSEEVESKLRSEDASKRAFGEHYSDSIKRNVQKENNKREKTYHNTEMLHNKNDEYISRRQMNDHDNVKKRNMCASSARDKSKDTLWSLERGQDRDSDWERTKEKDKYARDRTYDNRRSYERNYKHHRK